MDFGWLCFATILSFLRSPSNARQFRTKQMRVIHTTQSRNVQMYSIGSVSSVQSCDAEAPFLVCHGCYANAKSRFGHFLNKSSLALPLNSRSKGRQRRNLRNNHLTHNICEIWYHLTTQQFRGVSHRSFSHVKHLALTGSHKCRYSTELWGTEVC